MCSECSESSEASSASLSFFDGDFTICEGVDFSDNFGVFAGFDGKGLINGSSAIQFKRIYAEIVKSFNLSLACKVFPRLRRPSFF